MRLITPDGMSNPIWFQVDQWEERYETEPNDEHPDPAIGSTLPVVVNGQIMPGDVDRFSFTARKGTRLVMSVAARELMPYLADAVPGWFQAVLVLYDSKGDELVYAGAYYYRQDPVIYYEVPEDGEYFIEIRDSIYRGREDFVYRITLGELPFVTGIFPLGARAGTEVNVELQGLESGRDGTDGQRARQPEPPRSLVLDSPDRQGLHPLPAADRHDVGGPGSGAERHRGNGPGSHVADASSTAASTSRTTGTCSGSKGAGRWWPRCWAGGPVPRSIRRSP